MASASKQLAAALQGGGSNQIAFYEDLTGFFTSLDYQKEFWNLIKVLLENKEEDSSNRIGYYKNIIKLYQVRYPRLLHYSHHHIRPRLSS